MLGLLIAGALSLVPSGLHRVPGFGHRPAYAAAVAALMAVWWLTECIPIWLTALVPLAGFPLLGAFGRGPLGDLAHSAEPFVDAYVFLFLGGMAIGAAMETTQLHRRIALAILGVVGTHPSRLLLGMLVATAAVSMWISNTATAVMMTPIALAIVAQMERSTGRTLESFASALLLAVAYGSNIGGIGTKIGTGTNSIFLGFIAERMHRDIGFVRYLLIGVPFVVMLLPIAWMVLWSLARRTPIDANVTRNLVAEERARIGAMSTAEKTVASVFGIACTLWVLGDIVRPALFAHVPRPWPGFRFQPKHYEAAVALIAAISLALVRILDTKTIRRIPWHTLLLLGGSFAMAAGIEGSGLSRVMAESLAVLRSMSPLAQMAITAAATVGLSAVASNTATINVMLNVLPRSVPLFAASNIAASCDFALPAGTPPNAIVFGSGRLKFATMLRTGIWLDLIAIVLVTAYGMLYLRVIVH